MTGPRRQRMTGKYRTKLWLASGLAVAAILGLLRMGPSEAEGITVAEAASPVTEAIPDTHVVIKVLLAPVLY